MSVGERLLDHSMNQQAKQLFLKKMTKLSFPTALQSIVASSQALLGLF